MNYLLDTNVCIDAMRRVTDVIHHLSQVSPDDCAISTITTYELFSGVEKCRNPRRERRKVEQLLEMVHVLEFNSGAAEQAAVIRVQLESRGMPIGPYDTLLAGHALAAGLTLVTHNTKDFSRVPGLEYEDWHAA